MSHIATYAATLTTVNQDLLKKAMEIVMQRIGGTFSESVDSMDERDNVKVWLGKKIFAAIRTKRLPQGVGIILDEKGKPAYVYDKLYVAERTTNFVRNDIFLKLARESEAEFEAITKEIELTYKALAIAHALKALGYHVESETVESGIAIQGEKA
jgi:hypothetical protein